jgi:hypothetical protein
MSGVLNVMAAAAQIAAADLVGATVVIKGLLGPAALAMAAIEGVANVFDAMSDSDIQALFDGMKRQMQELKAIYDVTLKPVLDLVGAGLTLVIDLMMLAVTSALVGIKAIITDLTALLPEDRRAELMASLNIGAQGVQGMVNAMNSTSKTIRQKSAENLLELAGKSPTSKETDFVQDAKNKIGAAEVKKNLEEGSKSAGKAFMQYVYKAGNGFVAQVSNLKVQVDPVMMPVKGLSYTAADLYKDNPELNPPLKTGKNMFGGGQDKW